MFGTLASRTKVANKTFEVVFSLSAKLVFDPGQYVTITLPHLKNDPKGPGRIFSLVNTPKENTIIKILFRKTGSPYKDYLINMPLGEQVKISDPVGDFAPQPGNLVFLAAGIGIAPFMSMLPIKATWIYANSSKLFAPYLDKIPQDTHLIYTSKSERLDLNYIKKHIESWQSARYYLAGKPEFVEDLEYQLINSGLNPNNLKREAFDGE